MIKFAYTTYSGTALKVFTYTSLVIFKELAGLFVGYVLIVLMDSIPIGNVVCDTGW